MKIRQLLESATAGATSTGAIANTSGSVGGVIRRQKGSLFAEETASELKVWQVIIMNNYYAGKYSDYGGRNYAVLARSEDEAKEVVLKNADGVLKDLLSKKLPNGKRVLPPRSAVRITPDRVRGAKQDVATSSNGFRKMFGPEGLMTVKLANGDVIVQGQEQGVAEYGDTAKGQKMLDKVHHRAANRVTSKQADKDPAYARRAQQTQDRAWDRMKDKDVAEAEKKPHPKTWHDVDKKLGRAVDKMSQAEKVKKGLAHPDTLKKKGVAEVSKATLDKYVTKAVDAHGDADFAARMSKDDPTKRSYHKDQKKTAEKRRQGISRALDRMATKEGASDFVGNAIEALRSSKPGLGQEDFLDELYMYIENQYGQRAAEMMANAGQDEFADWYDSYTDMAEGMSEEQGYDEVSPKSASYILRKLDQGVPMSSILDDFPELHRMMEVIAHEHGLHPDDDFEQIEDVLMNDLEDIAAQEDDFGDYDQDEELPEVSLGDYRKKAGMQKAQAGMGAMFAPTPDQRAASLATFKKRERGLERVKARDEKARKAEQEKQLADLVARLPELKAEYEQMRARYKALGGSNWQYADRDQNMTDSEREARSMEGQMNNLWRQIQAAEKAQKEQGLDENKKGVRAVKHATKPKSVDAPKPRNFVAKNAVMGGAGAHKDKKKAAKQGDTKHKGKELAYESKLWAALERRLDR